MPENDAPVLAFPCDFPIKIMGKTQAGFAQAVQGTPKFLVTRAGNRLQQRKGELTPDNGSDLRDILGTPQPVEASHQRILQGEGHCARTQ